MKVNIEEYTDDGEDQVVEVHIDRWDTWSMDSRLSLRAYFIHTYVLMLEYSAFVSDKHYTQ